MGAQTLLHISRTKGLKLSVAESCTGGLLAAMLTQLPGSSDMFDRGFVTYSNAAKTEMLGVPAALIERFGAVSPQVALAMAQGALERSNAQVALSITGIAGPGGSDFKPEGRVCFATALAGGAQSETIEFGALGRDAVRRAACDHALGLLLAQMHSL